ncbi:MAG: COX15/CtaA family protein [Alphaproteobacteria bacterium]|nr:COX15/CtaA family protein [Alphaproteobacteria bacterium]
MPANLAGPRRFFASRHAVAYWLFAVAAIVVCMVTLGGLTRLTGSGLSITEWDPIMGAIPPLSDRAWHDAFAKYQRIPQYRLEHSGMTLEGFQAIFWWEWTHRLLGRLLGIAFFVPFVAFAWTGVIARRDWARMALLFGLGALQGFVGWWMVMSGLETRVSVSQYRLAIHLGVAILLLGAILWTALEYLRGSSGRTSGKAEAPKMLRIGGLAVVALIYIQMLLGALVAGLHAGLIYNTWPSMDGRLLPENPFSVAAVSFNFIENTGLVQFDHRMAAYVVFALALVFLLRVRSMKPSAQAMNASGAVAFLVVFQVALGIVTLLAQAPLELAAAHQLTAALLFSAAIWLVFELHLGGELKPPTPDRDRQ